MQWNLIPQVFYDMIGRFCPGAVVMIVAWAVMDGPSDMVAQFLPTANAKGSDLPFYAYIALALAAYFIADMLYQVSRKLFPRKDVVSSGLDDWKKRYRLLYNVEACMKKEDLPPIYIMLDYLRIHRPDEAIRLLKLKAERRLSAVIVVGFPLLGFMSILFCLKRLCSGSFDWERLTLTAFLFTCAALSYLRVKKSQDRFSNGTVIAFLTCVYEKDKPSQLLSSDNR